MNSFICRKVVVTGRSVYRCNVCGTTQPGPAFTQEIDTPNGAFPAFAPATAAHNMPEGWGSYYGRNADVYLCPACEK